MAEDENEPPSTRIVGGTKVTTPIPYQVSLQIFRPKKLFGLFTITNYTHFCGGSILNENYILTAAHCIMDDVSTMTVYAGVLNLLKNDGQRRSIVGCVKHPGYKEFIFGDIAVCKMNLPLIFNAKVGSIELNSEVIGGGVNCHLAGWGSIFIFRDLLIPYYNKAAYPNDLFHINLPTLTTAQCNAQLDGIGTVNDDQLCTFKQKLKGDCAGDSGGPLVCNGKQSGVVSFGTNICASGEPDVFTRVSSFIDWVNSNMFLKSLQTGDNSLIDAAFLSLPGIFN